MMSPALPLKVQTLDACTHTHTHLQTHTPTPTVECTGVVRECHLGGCWFGWTAAGLHWEAAGLAGLQQFFTGKLYVSLCPLKLPAEELLSLAPLFSLPSQRSQGHGGEHKGHRNASLQDTPPPPLHHHHRHYRTKQKETPKVRKHTRGNHGNREFKPLLDLLFDSAVIL